MNVMIRACPGGTSSAEYTASNRSLFSGTRQMELRLLPTVLQGAVPSTAPGVLERSSWLSHGDPDETTKKRGDSTKCVVNTESDLFLQQVLLSLVK